MKMRMAIATFVLVVGAFTLSACADKSGTVAKPTAAVTTTAEPTVTTPTITTPSVPATAADLVGDWQDVKAEWTVHFKDDGTYVEDFQGSVDFRVGKYAISEGVVSLIGDDGNADKGAVEGQSLAFNLGTLTRK